MSRYISRAGWCLLLGIMVSCARQMTEVEKEKLPRKKTQELIDAMDSVSHRKPNFFYSKISTHYADTNRSVNFKTSIRIVKDSALNALITYAKIPVIHTMVTKEKVTIVNKRDKCFITEDLEYFKNNFGVDFNYRNLEEMILGLPLDYDTNQKYFQIHDPYNYILSSHKKREIKRWEKLQGHSEKEDVIIKYYLTDDARDLKSLYIESPSDSTSIKVDYLSRELLTGYNIPKKVKINIKSPRNNVNIEMEYDKSEIDKYEPLLIVIPESYGKCQ